MAMIQCEECGAYISDRANACPHCGCPVQDDYMAGYEAERGAIQARNDYADEVAQNQARSRKNWNIKSIIICIALFFSSFGMGYSMFPKAVHGGAFYPIGIFIVACIVLVYLVAVKLWKALLFHLVVPHGFFINMILISLCGGYVLGSIMGM